MDKPETMLQAAERVFGILQRCRVDAVVIGAAALAAYHYLQIVSFAGRFPAVIEDALRAATLVVRPGSPMKVVPLPQRIALKLYAGGYKSQADIDELLARNPEADLDEIRAVCARYRLRGLEDLLAAAREERGEARVRPRA